MLTDRKEQLQVCLHRIQAQVPSLLPNQLTWLGQLIAQAGPTAVAAALAEALSQKQLEEQAPHFPFSSDVELIVAEVLLLAHSGTSHAIAA